MDYDLAMLISTLPLGQPRHTPGEKQFDAYRGLFPNKLLEYWREVGWGPFGDGLFWLVDPAHYRPALDTWLDAAGVSSDAMRVFARNAFGKLYVWDENSGEIATLSPLDQTIYFSANSNARSAADDDLSLAVFIGMQDPSDLDPEDRQGQSLFKHARKRLGVLGVDEIYGFEPALCLGGPMVLEQLRRVKAVEHLGLLAQLGGVRPVALDTSRHLAPD